MRALASLPDVPRINIIAHRAGVVNTAPASKAICQALAALQIALMWYNLGPPSTGARGRAREKRAGFARPLRAPGLEPPPTPAADHHRTPDAKGGTGGRTGDLKGDRARSRMRLGARPPWLAGRPLPREGARRSPRASARRPGTGACAQPPPRAALSALSPTVRGKRERRRRAAQELPARTPGCSDKKVGELAPQLCAASEGAPRLGRPKHLVLPATGWAGNGAEWGDGGAPRLRAVQYAAGMVGSKRAPGSVGAPPRARRPSPPRRARARRASPTAQRAAKRQGRAGTPTPNGRRRAG